jgi:hypothetical protein
MTEVFGFESPGISYLSLNRRYLIFLTRTATLCANLASLLCGKLWII